MESSSDLPHPTRRNWLWHAIQITLRMVFVTCLGYRARGIERISESQGGLLLVNHQSFLDPLLVGLPLQRPVSYLARDSLFPIPVIGWILRRTYVMPISRESVSTASLKAALARMNHGFLVGIFPEGTRSAGAEVGEFKPGFIALVRRVTVPVYPIGIAGADRAFPKGAKFLKASQVCVVFGAPMDESDLELLKGRGGEQAFLERARARVAECQQEAERWALSLSGIPIEPPADPMSEADSTQLEPK